MKKFLLMMLAALVFASCSTTSTFKVPKGHKLFVEDQAVESGTHTRSPMFWNRAGGIPYRLEKSGKTVEEGKLGAKFRVTSIFWPPFALIYWPMGFAGEGYDFTKETSKVRPSGNRRWNKKK